MTKKIFKTPLLAAVLASVMLTGCTITTTSDHGLSSCYSQGEKLSITSSGDGIVIIDGKQYDLGQKLSILGNTVYIDGIEQARVHQQDVNVTIKGNVDNINLVRGKVSAKDVNGNITITNGDAKVHDVNGGVSIISGDIRSRDIHGSASTVHGNITHRL